MGRHQPRELGGRQRALYEVEFLSREHPGEHAIFERKVVDEGHTVGSPLALRRERCCVSLELSRGFAQVMHPLATTIWPVQAGEELRNHTLQLRVEQLRIRTSLGQPVRAQAQHELFECLRRAEDADVADRARRKDSAQQVERQSPDRAAPRGLVGLGRERRIEMGAQRALQRDVRIEQPIHRGGVIVAMGRRHQLGVAVIPVVAVAPVGVRDVPRRLLQVAGEPPPLDRLGERL